MVLNKGTDDSLIKCVNVQTSYPPLEETMLSLTHSALDTVCSNFYLHFGKLVRWTCSCFTYQPPPLSHSKKQGNLTANNYRHLNF